MSWRTDGAGIQKKRLTTRRDLAIGNKLRYNNKQSNMLGKR
jgi:hypothetical protein